MSFRLNTKNEKDNQKLKLATPVSSKTVASRPKQYGEKQF
jgi:hypothetical protein